MTGLDPSNGRRHKLARWLLVLLALTALASVFMAYLDPHLVADLGNRLWSCF